MEVTNVQQILTQKAEESQKVKVPSKAAVNAYTATKPTDSADISAKARQLLSLRESYGKLEKKDAADIQQIKEKLDEGVNKLSSEEIVSSILKGTLFELL
jgi:hypothetical protein